MTTFGLLDWLITAASLIATLAAGVAVKRYVGNLEDFLVANRGMGTYVGTASLVSTEIGIITYMYQAQFGFLAGFSAFVVGMVTILVCYAVGRTGFVITRLREAQNGAREESPARTFALIAAGPGVPIQPRFAG